MAPARPLREIFEGLTGVGEVDADADSVLRASGHADLPEELLAEAIGSYADTARVEVAELLAPVVMAHRGMGADGDVAAGPGAALELLAAAPPAGLDEVEVEGGAELDPAAPPPGDFGASPAEGTVDIAFGQGGDTAFGQGESAPLGLSEPAAGAEPASTIAEQPSLAAPPPADAWGLAEPPGEPETDLDPTHDPTHDPTLGLDHLDSLDHLDGLNGGG
ncbi:hypothetical protein JQS43_18925 [Natronosporangium hydrolyticum]|uniref:Uncharacterized protein n=1 Tax=Natronosporangium hydrolyticum TaxID=2811111 RepID=A0A895YDW4_9ACTN|nr:hypothetical protein [Natronosporangium hydrolyticum]QSB13633.1 hypothetical protein JQS43_18925 [Natronosporangium hydrolyticum]